MRTFKPSTRPAATAHLERRGFVIFIALLALVSCAPPVQNDFEVQLETPGNVKVGKRPFAFALVQNGKPLVVSEVDISGQMTHAGMATQYATVKHAGSGRYGTRAFNFYMAGDWVMILSLKQGGKTQEAQVNLNVNP